jgi:hypothetical protein
MGDHVDNIALYEQGPLRNRNYLEDPCYIIRPKANGFLLGAVDERKNSRYLEIADPYNGDLADIRRCYQILQVRIHRLARLLFPPDQHTGETA